MWKITRGSWITSSLLVALFVVSSTTSVFAVTTNSPNYEASETEFGAGAALEACSGQYCASASIGAIGGESSSANFTAAFSQLTEDDDEPLLELMIEPGEADLGKLDIDRTATRTMLLHVRSHLAGGYTVQVTGNPPKFEGYSLATPIEPVASLTGTEQFAINVVANNTPDVGADPLSTDGEEEPVPGVVLPKYGTPNEFVYINGDIVARTASESSQIKYTVSMIVNVSGNTPAGHYSGDFSALVTPVF